MAGSCPSRVQLEHGYKVGEGADARDQLIGDRYGAWLSTNQRKEERAPAQLGHWARVPHLAEGFKAERERPS